MDFADRKQLKQTLSFKRPDNILKNTSIVRVTIWHTVSANGMLDTYLAHENPVIVNQVRHEEKISYKGSEEILTCKRPNTANTTFTAGLGHLLYTFGFTSFFK